MEPTPVEERLIAAGAVTGGRFSPNGLRNFQLKFATPASFEEFVKWRESPVTIAYLSALRALACTPPVGYVATDSIPVQFGVQSGVTLAAQLADDPTSLFPSLFSGSTSGAGAGTAGYPQTEYSVAPDTLPEQ